MEIPQQQPERSLMNDVEQQQVEAALISGELVTNPQLLNNAVAVLRTNETLDPLQSVQAITASSSHLRTLFDADIGLLRPCRLDEHTEADLGGLEQDYIPLFSDPEHRQILRFASFCKDSGKSLCNKATGDNLQQTAYNLRITEALLGAVDNEVMAADAKEAVRLLVEYDTVGSLLQGKFDQAQVDELRSRWPERFADQLADLVVTSYMSDASAHTAHRIFTDRTTGEPRQAVMPEDRSLDFLFEPHSKPVTLTQPYRRAVAALFPDAQATAALLRSDVTDEEVPTREYPYTTEADGIWSATLTIPDRPYEEVKQKIEEFAMNGNGFPGLETGFPISAFVRRGRGDVVSEVTLVRDPSRRFGTLSPDEHDQAAIALKEMYGWERQVNDEDETPDVSACVGLLEGYDEETGTLHKPVEAVTFLLEQGQEVSWRTDPTTLISARRVTDDTGEPELQAWDEKVMHITGTRRHDLQGEEGTNPALEDLKGLAGSFNQQRFFAEDNIANKTVAFAS